MLTSCTTFSHPEEDFIWQVRANTRMAAINDVDHITLHITVITRIIVGYELQAEDWDIDVTNMTGSLRLLQITCVFVDRITDVISAQNDEVDPIELAGLLV